ncbi:uncharacterized protein LOC119185900 [Rhipicephalus microplus]|uniref:uncharacterized protein LOC119185900 n=1 Tax=Rhipicephalus microplus TaxID=6941 RepID=UPI00188954CE|nr:uncharacterized protein LOC119185994 [Rhipicephalus microplus]
MPRRKEYLNPGSASAIPYSTKTYLERSASSVQQSRRGLQQDTNVAGGSTAPTALRVLTQPPQTDVEGDCDSESAHEAAPSDEPQPSVGAEMTDEPQGDLGSFSSDDLLALTVNFVLEFGIPWKGVEALQKLIMHILERHDIPVTKYLFKKSVGAEIKAARLHFYCENCMTLLAVTSGDLAARNAVRVTCTVCGQRNSGPQMLRDGHFFITLPIAKLLSSLLAENDASTALHERLNSINESMSVDKDEMTDIIDGTLYRALRRELTSKNDITLTVNSDGSAVFKSSKFSVWPVQVMVNELPVYMRQKNVLVSALWYGQKHPDMTLLLNAFVEQMDGLSTSGITWKAGNETVHSKVYCFSCSADAPARAAMQHLTQFNGYYGCGWCLHPGAAVNGTVKYPVDTVSPDRTAEGTKEIMAKAAEAGRPVQGAKGITPLINLQHFNIIWGFTPDYMHCVLLGVARQMTEDWLSNVGEEYYIGAPQTVAVLDQRLCSIKPHSCMPRLPRSVSLRKYWKASEWQQWLLYFSLPCLEGLLPRQYLKHFALLVKGIALLLQDTVSLSDISVSTDCLVKFVVDMQFLYGEKNMTFNVHQLLHMAQSVLNQGPLWAHSCFAFESNIGQIKQLVTSAKGAPLQIVERLMMASNFRYLKASASPCTLKFLTKAGPSNSKGGLLLSKPRAVSDQLLHLVQDHVGNIVRGRVMEHDRVIVSPGVRFHSEQYSRPNKSDSTVLQIYLGTCLKLKHIVSIRDSSRNVRIFALSNKFLSRRAFGTEHIMKSEDANSQQLVELSASVVPCNYVEVNRKCFFQRISLKMLSGGC